VDVRHLAAAAAGLTGEDVRRVRGQPSRNQTGTLQLREADVRGAFAEPDEEDNMLSTWPIRPDVYPC